MMGRLFTIAMPARMKVLTAFKGEDGAGNWTLSVCDTRNGEVGVYNRSQLIITSADPNTVTGEVFTDYSDNGIRDQGDVGVPGVTVTAYNAAGGVVGTAVTDSQGGYTFTGITNGTQLRIEFTNIPANLRPGAYGSDSGTTVQFVTSPAAGVDLGLAKPDEYCQNNPWLISPCYFNGNPLGGGTASSAEVLISIPYDAYGRVDNTIENTLATGAQIGATWGLAIQRSTGTIFAGALAKRHAGFGPLGAGGIYAIQMDPGHGCGDLRKQFCGPHHNRHHKCGYSGEQCRAWTSKHILHAKHGSNRMGRGRQICHWRHGHGNG